MSDIHERVGRLEQVAHTHDHRISQLEVLPPRVSEVERELSVMKEILRDIPEIRRNVSQVKSSQDKLAGALEALPRHIRVVGFIVFIAALSAVGSAFVP